MSFVVFLVCTVFVVNSVRTIQTLLIDRHTALADSLAADCPLVLLVQDQDLGADVLSSLDRAPAVEFACLLDRDGDVFVTYPKERANASIVPDSRDNGFYFTRDGDLEVYRSVEQEGGRVGTVYLRVKMDQVGAVMRRDISTACFVLGGSLIVVVLLTLLLQRTISTPILRLAAAAESVSSAHDYSIRVKKLGDDELGTLSDGFNSMLTVIQERDAELARHRTGLEALVQERTAELEREQHLLNSLVDNIPDPVFFKDRESRFVRANLAIAKTVGLADPKELIGKTDADIWRGELSSETRADECRIMETGVPLINKEEHPIDNMGRSRWVLVTKMPLRDEAGKITGTFGIARDITELKKYEQELERINAEFQRSNKELDDFAYVASHDLRSPLRAIHNLAKWIGEDEDNNLSQQSTDDLNKLIGRVKRMDGLLDGLLQFSRVGRKQYDAEEIDCGAMAREMADLLNRPEEFTVDVLDPMPMITAQRVPLEQVLRNLIDNAIKHHDRADGRIVVAAQDLGAFVEFSVSDDGPGIAEDYQEKVFQIFETIKTRAQVEGSGMGLALVKKIVESCGGTITLESGLGAGATFRFTWPKNP